MKTWIVYDSVFGNTARIAEAMGQALGDVRVVRAADVKPEDIKGLGLLIIGSPTRAFKPTKAVTDLLSRLPAQALRDVRTAAFDTRMRVEDTNSKVLKVLAKRFGYAADTLEKLLSKKGAKPAAQEGFYVADSEGPLQDGELERAMEWAQKINR